MMLIKIILRIFIAFCILSYMIISRLKKIMLTKELLTFDLILILFTVMVFGILSVKTYFSFFTKNVSKYKTKYYIKFLISYSSNVLNTYFYDPLKIFDAHFISWLKKKYNIKRIDYINGFLKSLYLLLKKNHFNSNNKYFTSYYLLKYVPKFIVIMFFIIDIFYFKKFYFFYLTIPLLLILLLLQYLKYSIFYEYQEFITYLELRIEIFDNVPSTPNNLIPTIDVKTYLDKVYFYHIKDEPNPLINQFAFTLWYYKNRTDEERNKKINYEILNAKYAKALLWIEKVHVIYCLLTRKEQLLDNIVNSIIYTCYFIGWSYILVISIKDTSFLKMFVNMTEPFSDLILNIPDDSDEKNTRS